MCSRSMIEGSAVTVVVPAYDEAKRIERVLRAMPASVDAVVVVDDASHDDTAARARAFAEHDPRVAVIVHPGNRGVGAAITTGYAEALRAGGGPRDAFVVMAGDGQMDPADLPGLVSPIAAGEAGYVKGNRFVHPEVRRSMPRARYLGGQAFSWATARATSLAISDSQCGYTALARSAAERLDLGALWPRYGYPNDLLSMLALRGIAVREVPVRPVYADEESRLRPRHLFTIAALVARAYARRKISEARAR